MALVIPADQVSIRGVKSSLIGPSGHKPMSFQYQPMFIQKRVETFDGDGFKLPGIPVPIAKDPKVTAGYSSVNVGLIGLATVSPDEFYDAEIVFATTDDAEITFECEKMVVDGGGLSVDPLSDSLQITFIITDPDSVSFG